MKPQKFFELRRWLYFFLSWFIGMIVIILIGQVVAVPLILWLFYDILYTHPSWYSLSRWGLWALFMGFFAGTVSWYYEKHSSGR